MVLSVEFIDKVLKIDDRWRVSVHALRGEGLAGAAFFLKKRVSEASYRVQLLGVAVMSPGHSSRVWNIQHIKYNHRPGVSRD